MERIGKNVIVFLPWTSIEPEAQQQILNTAKMPFVFKHVAVMPDCHYGKGATVGTVLATKGAVIPAAVGVDIGCGMIAVRTPLRRADIRDPRAVRAGIERRIPMSAGKNNAKLSLVGLGAGRHAGAAGQGDARHARAVRQELAARARDARRRQPLHRTGRRRRRHRVAHAALRLARRRQPDRQPLHQSRAGTLSEAEDRAARSRSGVSDRRPSGVRRVPARPAVGAAVRAAQSRRDDGPRAGGSQRRRARRARPRGARSKSSASTRTTTSRSWKSTSASACGSRARARSKRTRTTSR